MREGWNGWNVLHTAAARVGGLDMGFLPGLGGKTAAAMVEKGVLDVLCPARRRRDRPSRTDAFVVYLGTHGDAGAHRADVILPGADYTEKSGALRQYRGGGCSAANAPVFPKGEAKEDWTILRAPLRDRRSQAAV